MQKLEIDAATWAELSQLLDAALDQPIAERGKWLETLAPRFEGIKPQLRDLLSYTQQVETGDFLATLPKVELDTNQPMQSAVRSEQPGEVIGPYRLVRELGSGGMGTVWLAERADGLINRPVALKLPHGAWKRAGLAERMAREREILATLAHPNIARLYDAGLGADGQPFLALEYVEGRRIDEYCREQRLDPKLRLGLFAQVANAVAYAHGKLVVHRDLKPANILVTAEGQVRLLDFGIAKLTEEGLAKDTRLSELSGRALTLEYASPEQILGEPLTVASDVYSLGVVLYELLTDARPYRLKRDSRGALEEAILQGEAALLSDVADEHLRKSLRGDLDTIVHKALRKNPDERYPTVNAFAEDIERHLSGRPVLAQPDSRWYRASRFLGRNKLAVAAAGAVLIAILAGSTVAVWQAQVALAETKRAAEVKDFITSMLRDANAFSDGKAVSAIDLLKQARERIEVTFPDRPELRVELLNIVGTSLLGLEDLAAAESIAARALEEAIEHLRADDAATLGARVLMAHVHHHRGRTKQMREELDRVLPALRRRATTDPGGLVDALQLQVLAAIEEGRHDESVPTAKAAVDIAVARLGERDPRTAASVLMLAYAHIYEGHEPELALQAAEHARRLAFLLHGNDWKHSFVLEANTVYGRALAATGQLAPGIELLEQAMKTVDEKYGPSSLQAGLVAQNIVPFQLQYGQLEQAIANSEEGLRILAQHLSSDSFSHARSLTGLGFSLLAARKSAAALRRYEEALLAYHSVVEPSDEQVLRMQLSRSLALAHVGRISEARRDLAPSLQYYRATRAPELKRALYIEGAIKRLGGDPIGALSLQQESLALAMAGPKVGLEQARALTEVGLNQLELGHLTDAAGGLQRAIESFRELQHQTTPERADAMVGLGRIRMAQGHSDTALPVLKEADAYWREFNPQSRWAGEAALWLGRCHLALGRKPEAIEALRRAEELLARSPIPSDIELVKLARAHGTIRATP